MNYAPRSQAETSRNIKRTRYWWQFASALDVIDELRKRGITEFPARFKGMSDDDYKKRTD